MIWPFWKRIYQFFIEQNIYLPCDPVLRPILLSICSGEIKTHVHKNACMRVFIALFYNSSKQETAWGSISRTDKLQYVPTVEYYPIKRNKLLICIATRMNFKSLTHYMIPCIETSRTGKIIYHRKISERWLPWGQGWGEGEMVSVSIDWEGT